MAQKTYFGAKEILHNMDYEAISVTVDKTTTGTVTENGRTILKAGTILAGDGASIFTDRTKKVKKSTVETAADGVLLHDVDITDADSAAALVYRGTLREDRVNDGTVSDAYKALLKHIQFVKGV
ncbi:major capsid protein [Streptococcus phage Javan636]|uniref:hypothetical protein n=1 Tax=Streptococcus uberis TaxID=1349 RepID=UPI0006204C6A|nr:hypothetical protein [Streptococcus uberis]KKF49704.1 hypothetical protein AF60_09390 [Streptococcus uberis S6261]MCK1231851.1 hypothetical protein [Streptococcus uberis]QBX31378.1 major capsid protein [Streptococcus phage Javan636]